MRPSGRTPQQIRPVELQAAASRHAEGSCLITCGNTRVLCTASLDENPPRWLKGTGRGWVTAEYGMLPRATHTRTAREAAKGKQSGRTQEIQRLIGRALRTTVDLTRMGERQIIVDCDVIEADGGTRTASITGGYVALAMALNALTRNKTFSANPLTGQVAAISCGVYNGIPVADLDYEEDSEIDMDANFVLTADGRIVEIQCTAEKDPVSEAQFAELLTLARTAIAELAEIQEKALAALTQA